MIEAHAGRRDRRPSPGPEALLEVRGLDVEFRTSAGPVHAVNGVDLDVRAGEIVGLVGESGSGKSVTQPGRHGPPPAPHERRSRGSIRLGGDELVGLPGARYRRVRGERVAMIFQDPLTALDPLYRAGEQVAEALRFHFGLSRGGGAGTGRGAVRAVGLPDAGRTSSTALSARALGRHAPAGA